MTKVVKERASVTTGVVLRAIELESLVVIQPQRGSLNGAHIFMYIKRLFPVVVLIVILSRGTGNSQLRCPADTRADDLATRFVVSGGYVKIPVGAFLLVRKNGEIGAIRLTNIDPGSTEWVGKSTYESYFQGDGSGSLMAADVLKQTGELNLRHLKGPGRDLWIYQPGQNKARVGKWSFLFAAPNMMGMSAISALHGNGDHGYEFAPTSACDVSKIDAHDKRLRWFRFDPNAKVILPLVDLPK
jgi:hypothetical protein